MPRRHRESAVITSLIKNILNSYPAGNPILRELLQNSDDAGAKEQTFILDRRSYRTVSLLDPELKATQGPALLAVNDTLFSESDWNALAKINGSNKAADEAKTGKYGLGFRSCYHLTDNPQVLSGDRLQIFDPHERFADAISGGASIDVVNEATQFPDQISVFSACGTRFDTPYSGTVVRLPLRTPECARRSSIRNDSFTPNNIRALFDQFINEEASQVLLFLKNITKITFKDVSQVGDVEQCAVIEITGRKPPASFVNNELYDSFPVTVLTTIKGVSNGRKWRLFHYAITRRAAFAILRSMTPNVDFREEQLAEDKLIPHIGLAAPLEDPKSVNGSLFTYLPLPIRSGFHVHIHGCFALMPDRQGLRNKNETTMGNRETFLVTWNRFIFGVLTPMAWANMLHRLVKENEGDRSWDLWPIVPVSKNDYWFSLLPDVVKIVKDRRMDVFPTMSPSPSYASIGDSNVLFATESINEVVLATLKKAGLNIVHPPSSLLEVIRSVDAEKILQPAAVAHALSPRAVGDLSDEDKAVLLVYLLSDSRHRKSIEILKGMPLIPLAGTTPTWGTISAKGFDLLVPPSIIVEKTLSRYSKDMISLSRLPTDRIRAAFQSYRPTLSLRMRPLESRDVLLFLQIASQSWTNRSFLSNELQAEASDVDWLVNLWNTIPIALFPERLLLTSLHLLPTNDNSICRTKDKVFLPVLGPSMTSSQIAVWKKLGVTRFAHPNLLQPNARLEPHLSQNLSHLLKFVDSNRISSLTPSEWEDIKFSICGILNRGYSQLTASEVATLAKFKIFRVWKGDSQSVLEATSHMRYFVSDSLPRCPLPRLPGSPTFIQLSSSDRVICNILEGSKKISVLGEPDILGLAVQNWDLQATLQPRLLERIFSRFDDLAPDTKKTFLAKRFVTVGDTLKKATEVVDPESPIIELYLASERVMPTGFFKKGSLGLRFLQARGCLLNSLTPGVVQDRIDTLSTSPDADRFCKLQSLLCLLDDIWDSTFTDVIESRRDVEWIPCRMGDDANEILCAPQRCRDTGCNAYLFDLCLPLASINDGVIVIPRFRTALGWGQPFTLDQLRIQLDNTLSHPRFQRNPTRFIALIKEFSRQYQLNHGVVLADIKTWFDTLADRKWIPTESGDLVSPRHCLLQSDFKAGPFKQVSSSLNACHKILLEIGCSNEPSVFALVTELTTHATEKNLVCPRENIVVDLLRELARHDLTGVSFYLPCFGDRWQPKEHVYYGGPSQISTQIVQGVQYYQLHRSISSSIACSLGVRSHEDLIIEGLIIDDEEDSDDESQKSPLDKISRLLGDHDVEFAFNELLANALDAGATEFRVVHDKRSYKKQDVLTERLSDIVCGPALLIHNNTKFEEEDFKGLGKLARGSKQGRQDVGGIRAHGLGAIALYYFTDVPIVISNGHIMFMDPSKTYLTRRSRGKGKRTTLRFMLADFLNQYPSVGERLEGVLKFSQKEEYYNETIFWLPLTRGEGSCFSQHPRTSLNAILNDYEKLGQNSFFFTGLELIQVGSLEGDRGIRNYWEIRGTKEKMHEPDAYQIELASSYLYRPSQAERWLLVQHTCQMDKLPPEYNDVINAMQAWGEQRDLQLQEAIRLSPPLSNHHCGDHFLFSTLQLPIKLHMPFHINAPFAFPSGENRTHHEVGQGTANNYNRWLLRELIPKLHAKALAIISSILPINSLWHLWPTRQEEDGISQIIADSFFAKLHTFTDAFIAARSPENCCFALGDIPPDTKRLLKGMNLTNISIPPSNIAQQVEMNPDVKRLDAASIAEIIRENSDVIQKGWGTLFDSSDIDGTLLYLLESGFSDTQAKFSFDGLPLLITASGTLNKFDDCKPLYITRALKEGGREFQSNELVRWIGVDRAISLGSHSKSYQCLYEHSNTIPSISRLSKSSVAQLLEERLSKSYSRFLGRPETDWISMFFDLWLEIFHSPELEPSWDDLSDFPLLDTYTTTVQGQFYVSLRALEQEKVLYHIDFTNHKIPQLLTTISISMIRPPPNHLLELMPKSSLATDECIRRLAKMLVGQQDDIQKHIANDFEPLATWLRESIEWGKIDQPSPELLRLPIWEAIRDGKDVFAPLREIIFLPADADIRNEIIRDCFPRGHNVAHVTKQMNLSAVQKKRLSLLQLHQLLSPALPTRLDGDASLQAYGEYLQVMWSQRSCMSLRSPSQDGYLRPLMDLYDPSVSLFRVTLPRHDILHSTIRQQLSNFSPSGLYHHSVNATTFAHCGEAFNRKFNELSTTGKEEQATALYDAYKDMLPRDIMSCPNTWGQLDHIKFIRRHPDRCCHASYFVEDNFHNDLPPIISPSQVLQEKYKRVAWTQRGIPMVDPSPDLLQLNGNFGVPTVDEVVSHLRCLAMVIAPRHPQNSSLYEDICATYDWLNEKSKFTTISLAPEESLFLNVDDPKSDTWEWISASQLLLGLREDSDAYKRPRPFLRQFRSLLIAANVQEVTAVTLTFEKPDVNELDALKSRIGVLSEMRLRGTLVDAFFKPTIASNRESGHLDCSQFGFHLFYLATLFPGLQGLFNGDEDLERPRTYVFMGTANGCLAFLEFVYSGNFDIKIQVKKGGNDAQAQALIYELFLLLGFAKKWNLTCFKRYIIRAIANRIDPHTYRGINEMAAIFDAPELGKSCEIFEQENKFLNNMEQSESWTEFFKQRRWLHDSQEDGVEEMSMDAEANSQVETEIGDQGGSSVVGTSEAE